METIFSPGWKVLCSVWLRCCVVVCVGLCSVQLVVSVSVVWKVTVCVWCALSVLWEMTVCVWWAMNVVRELGTVGVWWPMNMM